MKCVIGVEQEPRIQFTIEADTKNMPKLIILNDGEKLVLSGRYASKGNNYKYDRVTKIYQHTENVKEWVQYSGLTG